MLVGYSGESLSKMKLILLVTSFPELTLYSMQYIGLHYSTDPFKLIEIILSSSSNRKYQPLPLLSFSVAVCLRWLNHHILSVVSHIPRGSWGFVSITFVQFMMGANNWVLYGLKFALHITHSNVSLSSLCSLIWRHWTYKCLSGIFCWICDYRKITSILSIMFM